MYIFCQNKQQNYYLFYEIFPKNFSFLTSENSLLRRRPSTLDSIDIEASNKCNVSVCIWCDGICSRQQIMMVCLSNHFLLLSLCRLQARPGRSGGVGHTWLMSVGPIKDMLPQTLSTYGQRFEEKRAWNHIYNDIKIASSVIAKSACMVVIVIIMMKLSSTELENVLLIVSKTMSYCLLQQHTLISFLYINGGMWFGFISLEKNLCHLRLWCKLRELCDFTKILGL